MAEHVGEIRWGSGIETKGIQKDAAEVESIAKKAGDGIGKGIDQGTKKADAAFKKFANTMKVGLVAGGLAAAAGLGAAVKATGNFQSSLSKLEQASSATGEEMKDMTALARELGKDTNLAGVTAADAAESMVELSKAGLSVNDTMDATRGVMSLAKAGNMDFADAAIIAASALNAFGMEGEDATKVADMLAAGANASQADLKDLAQGMQQSATVAKQFELSLQENVTALALFANNGIKGSDAGTSLKTMLIALANPSAKAATAMEEIGFQAYNAEGEFVGLEEMSKRLSGSLEGLTDEQKQATLATIFGTDAFRAAAVLADSAGETYDDMSNSVGKVGAAQEAAAAQMGPFQRATENVDNAMSDLGLTIGSYVIPHATNAANAFAGIISTINNGIPSAVATFGTLLPMIIGTSAAVVTYTVATNGAAWATSILTVAQGALNAVMKLSPWGLMAAGAAGIIGLFATLVVQTDSNKNAQDRLTQARKDAALATDAAKAAEDRLHGALLTQEGATLAVERATKNRDDAAAMFGENSLEYREAEYNLKRAKDSVKDAENNAKAALEERDRAQAESNHKKEAVKAAEAEKQSAVQNTTIKIENQISQMGTLSGQLSGLNGKNFSYSVTGTYTTYEQKLKATGSGVPFKNPDQRASGGAVARNQPYFVGENPDGSLNNTSELFVPSTSGHIVNSKDLQAALGSASSQPTNQTFNITLPNVNNAQDFAREFKLAVQGRKFNHA